MKTIIKVCSLFTVVAMMGASAASAQTLSPAGATVTASGQLTQSLGGTLTTVCNVTLTGTTDAGGIIFTSLAGTNANGGPLSCNDGLVLPLRVEATSPTSVTIKNMTVSTRLGNCGPQDVIAPWNNATSTAGPISASIPFFISSCDASGSLTISPSIQIN